MKRLLLSLLVVTVFPAQAETLRLVCRPSDPALSPPLAFSIDTESKQAVETTTGKDLGVSAYRDGFGLFDPAVGPGQVVYRIDRVSGRFVRVDTQLRLDGTCDKVEPKF